MLKSKYNWKSGAMANEYIDASVPTMKRNAEMLTGVTVEKKPKIEETIDEKPKIEETIDEKPKNEETIEKTPKIEVGDMVVKLSPIKGLDKDPSCPSICERSICDCDVCKKAKKATMSAESLLKGFSFGKNCSVNITLNTSE